MPLVSSTGKAPCIPGGWRSSQNWISRNPMVQAQQGLGCHGSYTLLPNRCWLQVVSTFTSRNCSYFRNKASLYFVSIEPSFPYLIQGWAGEGGYLISSKTSALEAETSLVALTR